MPDSECMEENLLFELETSKTRWIERMPRMDEWLCIDWKEDGSY